MTSFPNTQDIGKTDLVQMFLQPKDNIKPLNQKLYTLPLRHHAWLRQELTDLEKAGTISPSTLKFASPVIIVPKQKDPVKLEITYRMVVNFRKMNEQLEYWSYPLMHIDRIFSKLNGSKLFSTFDVISGYYNITIAEESRQYTAFTTAYGKYEFLRVSFGIHVAPSYFTLMINETLKGLDFCFAYLDNTIIYSKTERHLLDHINRYLNN